MQLEHLFFEICSYIYLDTDRGIDTDAILQTNTRGDNIFQKHWHFRHTLMQLTKQIHCQFSATYYNLLAVYCIHFIRLSVFTKFTEKTPFISRPKGLPGHWWGQKIATELTIAAAALTCTVSK